MKCPICLNQTLQPTTLDTGLPAFQCSQCQGIWIASNQYLNWLRSQPSALEEKAGDDIHIPTWDTQVLKLCPQCGHIMTRYRVLPGVNFWLDHCGHCNGVWFEKDEWNVLLERNLQDKVNAFFTQSWQAKIREAESRRVLDKLYLEKFGAADYEKIKEIHGWLMEHPQRSMLLAYLQAENPYKI